MQLTASGNTSAQQAAIQAKCVNPNGSFVAFAQDAIDQFIPDRFEHQASLYPDRLAVEDENEKLTYDSLNQSANRVARAVLTLLGEGPEPVALLLDHGSRSVVAESRSSEIKKGGMPERALVGVMRSIVDPRQVPSSLSLLAANTVDVSSEKEIW